jgi:translation elongation factor EF-G
MRREFKVEVNQGEPQVEYKEAFTKVLFIQKQSQVVVNSVISYLSQLMKLMVKLQLDYSSLTVKVVTFLKNIFHLLKGFREA